MSIANELITRGWTQYEYEDDEGRVCLAGAAMHAAGFLVHIDVMTGLPDAEFDTGCVLYKAMRSAIRESLAAVGADPTDISAWNDYPGRTFDEALRIAKQADEILDSA